MPKNSNPNSMATITSSTKTRTIDFESDDDGLLLAGDTGDQFVFADFTVTGVSNSPSGISNEAMIFDSANPTGGDTDLATVSQGNLLIVSEDGDSSDPDDEAGGGTLTFDFNTPVNLTSIALVDAFEGGAQFEAFDSEGNSLGVIVIAAEGDGSDGKFGTVDLSQFEDVSQLVVTFDESGAVDDLMYEIEQCITVDKDISNIVLYLDCEDEVIKFKIDDFGDGVNEITVAELEQYLDKTDFGDCDILGLTIKAGNNGGEFGPGEGEYIDVITDDTFDTGTSAKADVEVSAADFFMHIV